VGVGAVVAGGVLLGTGVAVSAQTTHHAVAATANKKKKTTTTTLAPTTTTTTIPASTTTQPCQATSATVTAVPGQGKNTGSATVTVSPATCLVNGTPVEITATGLSTASSNFLGTFIECNSEPTQPTVNVQGNAIPVSCTGALAHIFTPDLTTGDASSTGFTAVEGTTGPTCAPACTNLSATDSTGGDPYVDAAKYPCPPTAAQLAETPPVTCVIAVGDVGGDQASVPISFNTAVAAPSTTIGSNTATTVATKTAAKGSTTKTSSSSLAFTGSGPGLWWLALVGMVLIVFGGLLLTLVDQPRRLIRIALRRSRDDT
jgi:hypothetical protein